MGMQTPDFFRSRFDVMINLSDPLAVLAKRLRCALIEAAVAAKFELITGAGGCVFRRSVTDRFGIVTAEFGSVTEHFGDVTDGRLVAA